MPDFGKTRLRRIAVLVVFGFFRVRSKVQRNRLLLTGAHQRQLTKSGIALRLFATKTNQE
jgi:hypothetical protein